MFVCHFRREGLSNSWWAEEIDDQTVSLAFDEVVESNFLMVRFNERLEVLAVVGEDEVSKCVGVPIDIANFLDVKFHYEEKVNVAREAEEKGELTPHFIHKTEAEDNSDCEKQIFISKLNVSCSIARLGLNEVTYRMEGSGVAPSSRTCYKPWVNIATGCGIGFPYGSNWGLNRELSCTSAPAFSSTFGGIGFGSW